MATDVAARGLGELDIGHLFNFNYLNNKHYINYNATMGVCNNESKIDEDVLKRFAFRFFYFARDVFAVLAIIPFGVKNEFFNLVTF